MQHACESEIESTIGKNQGINPSRYMISSRHHANNKFDHQVTTCNQQSEESEVEVFNIQMHLQSNQSATIMSKDASLSPNTSQKNNSNHQIFIQSLRKKFYSSLKQSQSPAIKEQDRHQKTIEPFMLVCQKNPLLQNFKPSEKLQPKPKLDLTQIQLL